MMGDSCFFARTGAGGGDGPGATDGSADRSTAIAVGRFLIFVLIRWMVPNSDIERFASPPSPDARGLSRSPASLTLLVNLPPPEDDAVDRLFGGAAALVRSVDDRYC
jgi:hypothetical protein